MLKVTKSRNLYAEFTVTENGQEQTVKTTNVMINNEGVSEVNENFYDKELYAKHRKEMRKDEAALRQMRYDIEDEVMSELDAQNSEETGE